MIIAGSQVILSSSREAESYTRLRESLTVWQQGREAAVIEADSRGQPRQTTDLQRLSRQLQSQPLRFGQMQQSAARFDVQVDISSQARRLQAASPDAPAAPDAIDGDQLTEADGPQALKIALISLLYEKLTGRKLDVFDAAELEHKQQHVNKKSAELQSLLHAGGAGRDGETSAGWGLRYDRHETYHESEKVNVSARAAVTTADGRQIDIALELNLSREFISEERISIRAGDALKDPLVINYAGNAAELTESKFSFDIDTDGREETLSFVQYGSGFLAYDKNANQQIDDGSELFGAMSGDGFSELAAYDQDGNGWIDENDAIYTQLKIWSKQADGTDELVALARRDVGAIYLGRVSSEFSLNDADNRQHGQLRSTGIFLAESGAAAGTIQQIDLVA